MLIEIKWLGASKLSFHECLMTILGVSSLKLAMLLKSISCFSLKFFVPKTLSRASLYQDSQQMGSDTTQRTSACWLWREPGMRSRRGSWNWPEGSHRILNISYQWEFEVKYYFTNVFTIEKKTNLSGERRWMSDHFFIKTCEKLKEKKHFERMLLLVISAPQGGWPWRAAACCIHLAPSVSFWNY